MGQWSWVPDLGPTPNRSPLATTPQVHNICLHITKLWSACCPYYQTVVSVLSILPNCGQRVVHITKLWSACCPYYQTVVSVLSILPNCGKRVVHITKLWSACCPYIQRWSLGVPVESTKMTWTAELGVSVISAGTFSQTVPLSTITEWLARLNPNIPASPTALSKNAFHTSVSALSCCSWAIVLYECGPKEATTKISCPHVALKWSMALYFVCEATTFTRSTESASLITTWIVVPLRKPILLL